MLNLHSIIFNRFNNLIQCKKKELINYHYQKKGKKEICVGDKLVKMEKEKKNENWNNMKIWNIRTGKDKQTNI